MTSQDRDLSDVDDFDREGSRSSSSPGRARKHLPVWQETILLLVVALFLAIGIKAFLVQPFYIPSESMEPGLVKDDRILVQKPSYWFGDTPQRGDVVVFKDPGGWLSEADSAGPSGFVAQALAKIGLYPTGGHLVKRVIGVEGDIIECCDEQGRLKVNGVPLEESSYARPGECYGPMIASCSWTAGPVPGGKLFVMGDNRANSADSSRHLCTPEVTECSDSPWVDTDLVVGRLMAVVWPLGKARFDHRPEAFESVASAAEEQ